MVGTVGRAIAIDLYIKRLSARFGYLCDPLDVEAANPATPIQPVVPEVAPKPQKQRVLDAIENVAITTADMARDTGIPQGACSAIACALEGDGKIHRSGSDKRVVFWEFGPAKPQPAASNPVENTEMLPDKLTDPQQLSYKPNSSNIPVKPLQIDPKDAPPTTHTKALLLKSGGSIYVTLTCNMFALDELDRAFVFDLVDRLAGYRDEKPLPLEATA